MPLACNVDPFSTPEACVPRAVAGVPGSIVAIEAAVSTRAPLTALYSFLPVAPAPPVIPIYSAVSSLPAKDFVVAINIPVTVAIDSSVSRPRIEDFIITISSMATIPKDIGV
jgi:hypothetical protein